MNAGSEDHQEQGKQEKDAPGELGTAHPGYWEFRIPTM
jgi:hypothetical protein